MSIPVRARVSVQKNPHHKMKPNDRKLVEYTQQMGQQGFRFIILDGEDNPIVFHLN